MRKQLIYFITPIVVIASASAVKYFTGLGEITQPNRTVASVAPVSEVIEFSGIELGKTETKPMQVSEVYQFERRVSAKFNSKTLADTHYEGFFFVEWLPVAPTLGSNDSKNGRFSFQLKDGSVKPLYLEAVINSQN